jgi:hypothetical protein
MKQFFAKYPVIYYPTEKSGVEIRLRDILQRVRMRQFLANNYLIFYPYTVKDGETPEIIAAKLYDSAQYHWIVLIVNNIIDPYYDWPLSQENLINTLRKRYSSGGTDGLWYAYQTTHHYEDLNANTIDFKTYNALPAEERNAVSIYDYEVAKNEAKREIRLLDKRFVSQIDSEMDALLAKPIAK